MARSNVLLLSLLLIPTISVVAWAEPDCVYTFYLQTGTNYYAGTDSVISATISDQTGQNVEIKNLETWGLMEQGHNYYENGNMDIFSGKARCLPSPICLLNLTSDGTGPEPGWYVNYVEVTTVKAGGAQCVHQRFDVEQWLAVDEPPYDLTVVRNKCPTKVSVGVKIESRMSFPSIV